jgi:hypothetical protein
MARFTLPLPTLVLVEMIYTSIDSALTRIIHDGFGRGDRG